MSPNVSQETYHISYFSLGTLLRVYQSLQINTILPVTEPPAYPDSLAQHLGVDEGKRCTYLDLREATDQKTMQRLVTQADVFTNSYRPGVNPCFGLIPADLAASSERGIICMDIISWVLNCFNLVDSSCLLSRHLLPPG